MPRRLFKRYMPHPDSIKANKSLRFLGNLIHDPNLWHLNRHSAAGAVAVGLVCGLIPGPLQMLGAAVCCLIFRVNLPLALATTLYTNPLTIVPLYILAFSIGEFALGTGIDFIAPPAYDIRNPAGWMQAMSAWTYGLGKPLAAGLVLLASLLAVIGYFSVKAAWRWYLIRAWKKRRRPTNS